MEKNEIKSALEVALELKNELLVLSERSHELVHQLELLLQSGETNSTRTSPSMPKCLDEIPWKYKYLKKDLWRLLERAHQAGILDEELQPLCSWQEASVLANIICDRLKIKMKWQLFAYIWDSFSSRLNACYQQALKSEGFVDIEQRMLKILCDAVPNY